MVKDINGMCKYVGEVPTQIVANALTKEVHRQARIYNVDWRQHNTQLSIQPLKKVERIAPLKQPVQEVEEQHTPYPIMDIVIAFLAGMIAAGFISIIWK